MKKKVLFLGDGIYTKNLLNLYDDNLFDRYLFDYKIKKSRSKKFKKTFQVNLLDKKKILLLAKKLKIDHVITNQNDFAIPVYGHLCSKLRLSGIPENICIRFTNKKKCRTFLKNLKNCKKYIPNFYFNRSSISKAKQNKDFILKPAEMQGSRYVEKLHYKDLKEKIKNFKKHKINYLIEDFIQGQDYAVESVVINKKVYNLVISKKIKFLNSFIDKRIFSKNLPENIIEKRIFKINEHIIKNLKLKNGLAHLEFRVDKTGKVFLIEAACRGAGSGISNIIVPYLSGFNTDKFLFLLSLGKIQAWYKPKFKKRKTVLYWLSKKEKLKRKKLKNLLFYKKDNISEKISNSEDRGTFYIKSVN